MTTYLMALVLYTTTGDFIQRPSEPMLAKTYAFDEKGELVMKNPITDDCYIHRQDSKTFKVFCRKEEEKQAEEVREVHIDPAGKKAYEEAMVILQ
jgi:hypothetical protein